MCGYFKKNLNTMEDTSNKKKIIVSTDGIISCNENILPLNINVYSISGSFIEKISVDHNNFKLNLKNGIYLFNYEIDGLNFVEKIRFDK